MFYCNVLFQTKIKKRVEEGKKGKDGTLSCVQCCFSFRFIERELGKISELYRAKRIW